MRNPPKCIENIASSLLAGTSNNAAISMLVDDTWATFKSITICQIKFYEYCFGHFRYFLLSRYLQLCMFCSVQF